MYEKDLFNCLPYFDFDPDIRKSIRTINILEWAFRKMRRRTRTMDNSFTNWASSDRIMVGITDMLI
ncbi:MAG: transposase [Desulfobaccales bacterium]|nr:transposase [Desulfobaccales bacterium]